jgi:hypothetical protein
MNKILIRGRSIGVARWCSWLAAVMPMAVVNGAMGAKTVLDFEDVAAGTTITSQYGMRGVIFHQAFLGTDSAARSGTRVLRTVSPTTEVFTEIPLVMSFTSAQSRVKLFAGSPGVALNGTLTAFNADGDVVATDGPRLVAQDVFTTMFEVTVATESIRRAELQLEGSAHQAIDDLEFEGKPPVPTPTEPPIVKITSPLDGVDLDVETIDIAGTVTGEGLLGPVKLTMEFRRPPESTAGPFRSALALTGTGTTRTFSLEGFTGVPLGPITVTVEAENIGAVKGTGSSTFTNLPRAIVERFDSEGGAATFGEFQFGLFGKDGCKIAIYEMGAIGIDNSKLTAVVRGDILTKWLSLRGLADNDGLGCPIGEERDALGGARAQDFQDGRIYGQLRGGALPGTAFVPAVFVDAIDKRGEEAGIGLPLGDPTESIGSARTWLFQRFFRPDAPDLLPSTMEIRGTPPKLWMERQLGGWFHFKLEPSDFDQASNRSAATLWESFDCEDNLGPCTVAEEPPFPPENTPNVGDLFCDGTTYNPVIPGRPPEWVAIQGNYVATPAFGATIAAHMTSIDNGLTHETHNGNCPYLTEGLGIGSALVGVPVAFGAFVAANEYGLTCASDFEFFVHPIGSQGDTSPLPSLFGKKNTDRIKTEYEVYYAAAAHNFLRAPAIGDLVHTTGRWIVDCGHDTYKTELHPIFSYATMKTVTSEPNTFTGLEVDLFGGIQATRVAIWVNGWYPGGEDNAIEFDIFPPPRPSPDAVLHVSKPVDNAAGGYRAAEDVTLEYKLAPPLSASHVHLKFTAPRRENHVTGAGEMKFQSGRQYWGIWYVHWGE